MGTWRYPLSTSFPRPPEHRHLCRSRQLPPQVYAFLRKLVAEGRQVYIVCPMVEENDELPDERKAVTAYARMLREEVFPDLRVVSVHGKMKPRERRR